MLCVLPGIVTIPLCSLQCLTNSFMRLISYCSLFIMAITQMRSQDSVLSPNNAFILCQTAPRAKTTFCCQCTHVCRTTFAPETCTDLLVIPWPLLGQLPGSLQGHRAQDSQREGMREMELVPARSPPWAQGDPVRVTKVPLLHGGRLLRFPRHYQFFPGCPHMWSPRGEAWRAGGRGLGQQRGWGW